MAYNNYTDSYQYPQSYSQFNQNYNPYYQPQSYQNQNYVTTQPVQNQQVQSQGGIIWVQGEAGAKSYPVAPNSKVLLMDSESPVLYVKSVNANGMPEPLCIYDLVQRDEVKVQTTVPEDRLGKIEERLSKIENRLQNNRQRKENNNG